MSGCRARSQLGPVCVRQLDWQLRWFVASVFPVRIFIASLICGMLSVRGEELSEVSLDGKARPQRVHCGIGRDLGGVEVEFLAPDQPRLHALRDDRLKDVAEDGQAVPLADAGETGVVGEWLRQVIPERVSVGSTDRRRRAGVAAQTGAPRRTGRVAP
jgi:hypothetical protein